MRLVLGWVVRMIIIMMVLRRLVLVLVVLLRVLVLRVLVRVLVGVIARKIGRCLVCASLTHPFTLQRMDLSRMDGTLTPPTPPPVPLAPLLLPLLVVTQPCWHSRSQRQQATP